jgi:starch synthase
MKILLATTEAVPFSKTGGLGDVCGSLPIALSELGHDVAVIMPAFRSVHRAGLPIEPLDVLCDIPIGRKSVEGRFLKSHLPESRVPVYLVDQPIYYDRKELYGEAGQDYRDNCERFVFFCRAVLEAIRLLDLKTDILHANDWQTGLIPAYLKLEYRGVPPYEPIASLFTIHNLAYQGNFWHWDMLLTGLDWKYFNWRQMEYYGDLSFMKTALVFADALSTVSPRYAEEIQSPPLGCGMEGVLQHRREDLTGIVNGVDYREWNPAHDPHLACNYDEHSVHEKKPVCKADLQRQLGLPTSADVPLLGAIGRMTDQKGFDLIGQVMQEWAQREAAQWVILGTGEEKYHQMLQKLAERHPNKVAVRLEFSSRWAHLIEAGADMLLMPSRFEPCGLSQMHSLKYGTVPVVRTTGGLADTIQGATESSIASGRANGFSFREYSSLALSETLRRACDIYRGDRPTWKRLIETGMSQDWSWSRSARQFAELYQRICQKNRSTVLAR